MAAAATPPGVVDPTKPAKYPVILSDALLGKSPKEILTAIRCKFYAVPSSPGRTSRRCTGRLTYLAYSPIDNHKPILSTDAAPDTAKLKPSSSSPSAYDLTYTDDGGNYAFHGTRSTKENQYVLIFDPERKAFVLHRIDSTFNMNLIKTPATSDAEALRDEYPHLADTNVRGAASSQAEKKKAGPSKGAGKGKKGSSSGMFMENKKTAPKKATNSNNKDKETSGPSAVAAAAAERKKKEAAEKEKKQQKQRNRSPIGSDEDEDSDDGFIIEYPDPVDTAPVVIPPVRSSRASPPAPSIRRFDEFLSNQQHEDSDEDADAEYDEEDFGLEQNEDSSGDNFKLPSPVGRTNNNNNHAQGGGGEEVDDDTPEDDELMAMLEEEIGGGMDVDSESSVSEED